MQFMVTGRDGTDEKAMERRLAVRTTHLAGAEKMQAEGTLLYAAALLNEAGQMAGSVMLVEFDSEEALRRGWLDAEPYVTGDVWRKLTIEPIAVPGFILKK